MTARAGEAPARSTATSRMAARGGTRDARTAGADAGADSDERAHDQRARSGSWW